MPVSLAARQTRYSEGSMATKMDMFHSRHKPCSKSSTGPEPFSGFVCFSSGAACKVSDLPKSPPKCWADEWPVRRNAEECLFFIWSGHLEPLVLQLDTWWRVISFSVFQISTVPCVLSLVRAPALQISRVHLRLSPVRRNRECRRFPTRVGSVSAVCGMLSLRVSMQVDGRCATDGTQDVIFLP